VSKLNRKTYKILFAVLLGGILVGFVIFPQYLHSPIDTNYDKTKSDIAHISNVLALYHKDNGNYPSTDEGLKQLVTGNKAYMERLPKDPWGNSYQYNHPGLHNKESYDLWSPGADGVEGGTGAGADITNW
jgi:general secretion pathway protein G